MSELDLRRWPSFPCLIDALGDTYGDATALASSGETLTYRGLADAKDAYAKWAAQTCVPGETVCLLMGNCASYFAIWLGLIQAGHPAALLNTHLRGEGLLHAVQTAGARIIVTDSVLLPVLERVRNFLPPGFAIWVHGDASFGSPGISVLDRSNHDGDGMTSVRRSPAGTNATALLIFTSGTTGLPKAAPVSHHRLLEWSLWFAGIMDTKQDDRLYNCLPMYHSTGGVAGIGGVLVNGGTVVLAERFSRSRFWADIVERGCTIFLYIGELCRYLTQAGFEDHETRHQLRLCCGNGLRADVWDIFQARFKIPAILEFYASTEGNVSLYNCEGRPGAIGRVPGFLAHRSPVKLIACDIETGEALRQADGTCVSCAIGESGEAIGKISGPNWQTTRLFEGYSDSAATERKILRDVFEPGDAWFRSGDLMRQDSNGFFYFVDRMGDSFRWKGENVSTTEVADVLAGFAGVTEAIVYGVRVDGNEGRACMAALTVTSRFDLDAFPDHAERHLPHYARPMFLRLCDWIETTGTFKPQKAKLSREAYDVSLVSDPVYAFDSKTGRYVKLERPTPGRTKALLS